MDEFFEKLGGRFNAGVTQIKCALHGDGDLEGEALAQLLPMTNAQGETVGPLLPYVFDKIKQLSRDIATGDAIKRMVVCKTPAPERGSATVLTLVLNIVMQKTQKILDSICDTKMESVDDKGLSMEILLKFWAIRKCVCDKYLKLAFTSWHAAAERESHPQQAYCTTGTVARSSFLHSIPTSSACEKQLTWSADAVSRVMQIMRDAIRTGKLPLLTCDPTKFQREVDGWKGAARLFVDKLWSQSTTEFLNEAKELVDFETYRTKSALWSDIQSDMYSILSTRGAEGNEKAVAALMALIKRVKAKELRSFQYSHLRRLRYDWNTHKIASIAATYDTLIREWYRYAEILLMFTKKADLPATSKVQAPKRPSRPKKTPEEIAESNMLALRQKTARKFFKMTFQRALEQALEELRSEWANYATTGSAAVSFAAELQWVLL